MIKHIPNFLTLCNLMCGIAAIFFIFLEYLYPKGYYVISYAFVAIVAAAVFDFLDGMAARLLKAYSEVGKQLDSLADMVSFGVVPAIAITASMMLHTNSAWASLGLLLAPAAALRLAKFNVDTRQSEEFRGLAVPAMALFVMSYVACISSRLDQWGVSSLWSLGVVGVLSILMLCDLPMFSLKFKSFDFKSNVVRYVFLLLSVLIVVFMGIYGAPAIIISLYIGISAVQAIVRKKA